MTMARVKMVALVMARARVNRNSPALTVARAWKGGPETNVILVSCYGIFTLLIFKSLFMKPSFHQNRLNRCL